VVAAEGSAITCGYLTVLEDRADPSGQVIRIFVTRAEPLDDGLPPDPMLQLGVGAGRDLGWASRDREVGAVAGRVNLFMDVRGTGYSEPSLSCPEVEAMTDPSFGVALGTPQMEPPFLAAIQACHDRLTASGIDLASYNLASMAADAEDLRVTLGIDDWNLITYGTTSSIAFEIMRRYPEHIRSASFDSPTPPQLDPFTQAVVGTDWAFGRVAHACETKRVCHKAFPNLRAAWREALDRLDAHPSSILDEDLEIVVDDATAVQHLRNNLALGGHLTFFPVSSDVREFPLAIYDLRDHGWVNGEPAGDGVQWGGAPPFLVGSDIQWWPFPGFLPKAQLSHGTLYSYLCRDEVPFVDHAALAEAAGNRPWYVGAYVQNHYDEICARWDVEQAETDPHEPLVSDIPTLMLVGEFDSFSPLPLVKDAANGLSNASIVYVRDASRNVLDNDCTIGIRNAFVDEPTSAPDTSCVRDLPGITFVLPPPPTIAPGPRDAVITTVAGDGAYDSSGDGTLATQAQLEFPESVVADSDGNLYILEFDGERIRKVDASTGRISTVVGSSTGAAPPPPGDAGTVTMTYPTALAIDAGGDLYIGGGDRTHRIILRVDPVIGEVTHVAGTGEKGFSGDGGPATEARTTWIRDIAVDDDGNVYFTDFENHRIRMVDTAGIITTIAGTGEQGFSGDGGPATEARLNHPTGIALDPKGRITFADSGNHRVRRISLQGVITTVAGNGNGGCSSGEGAPAIRVALEAGRVRFDTAGNLYVWGGHCGRIWMVDPQGVVTTIAGTGVVGFSGDGGPATRARLSCCGGGMAFGPDGALYVADAKNNRVRKVVFP
jgi:pimeloyl-ACP methyl ester carboxylesterase/sugar lactone lactonase YvrE